MLRHMFVTFLIVATVYTSLLFLIGHPFVATAAPEMSKTPAAEISAPDAAINPVADKAELTPTESRPFAEADVAVKASANSSQKGLPVFQPSTMFGVSRVVDLQDEGLAVSQLWQELLQNKQLVNKVDWQSNDIKAYAYYSEFNQTMSKARLSIGFVSSSIKRRGMNVGLSATEIPLPAGKYRRYQMDFDTGALPDKAWANALLNDNLVERHTLNRDGERVTADAIIVMHQEK